MKCVTFLPMKRVAVWSVAIAVGVISLDVALCDIQGGFLRSASYEAGITEASEYSVSGSTQCYVAKTSDTGRLNSPCMRPRRSGKRVCVEIASSMAVAKAITASLPPASPPGKGAMTARPIISRRV